MAEPTSPNACAECGARLESGASFCTLCGAAANGDAAAATCAECGTENPPGANFCQQCGTRLDAGTRRASVPAAAPTAADADGPSQQVQAGRQAWMLVGMAIVIVLALYGVTVLTQKSRVVTPTAAGPVIEQAPNVATAAPQQQPPPPEIRAQIDSLETVIAAADGTVGRLGGLKALQDLYVENNQLGLAGEVQERIAAINDTAESWTMAGNLYFDWMNQQQDRDRRIAFSKRAAEAYRKALAKDPDNLDVKTDLAVAYLEDPNNPMQAVQLTREVLDANPDHLQANFNLGVMLNYIGRTDQALEQFEKVKSLTEPGSPIHTRAQQMIDTVQGNA